MGKNSQFLQLISYYEHLITQYENKGWKKVKKDEITEYVISKIILPKVLLLRDIPTLRTLLFIFNSFLERSNLLVLYVKLTQWYSEFECLWWKGWSRIYSVAWSCDCRWLHPNMVPVAWLTGIGAWGNYCYVRKNIDNIVQGLILYKNIWLNMNWNMYIYITKPKQKW
jgi:hypothetical protein